MGIATIVLGRSYFVRVMPSLIVCGVGIVLTVAVMAGALKAEETPARREQFVILTPKPPATPRINGARVFGVRPGRPFLFTIPATGQRPMEFAVDGLPVGLKIDAQSGQITGSLASPGEYVVTFRTKNALGEAQRKFRIVCGDSIALTPPMGWNSWNCFGGAVDDAKVRSAADAMVRSGLIQHGWTYINVDDCWGGQGGANPPSVAYPPHTDQGPPVYTDKDIKTLDDYFRREGMRDCQGNISPGKHFPDMKALAGYIHSKGLKAGLYTSPGPLTCGRCAGAYQHEEQDARRFAEWGFDFLKYDYCEYHHISPSRFGLATSQKPYRKMSGILRKLDRDIVFSICQYGVGDVWKWGAEVGGNCWRTTGDITDTWQSLSDIGFGQAGHETFAGPGHWNDVDMLIVGHVGWGSELHPTRLTPNEQYTHISLWCLLSSPLLIGCDMTQLDDFTLGLLTNDEVLEVNQDPLGKQAGRIAKDGHREVWAKSMEDGSKAAGLFNRGESETVVTAKWSELGVTGKQIVRDLWRQKDLGTYEGQFSAPVGRHGVVLISLRPAT